MTERTFFAFRMIPWILLSVSIGLAIFHWIGYDPCPCRMNLNHECKQ